MLCNVTLHFPFRINGKEHTVQINTVVLRKESTVSFALPFSALVSVDAQHEYTVHYSGSAQSSSSSNVCIDFKSINDAMDFSAKPEVHLSQMTQSRLLSVDQELERVSSELSKEKGHWRKKQRRVEVDEDGFTLC
ncbi:hypothetical protein NECID01_0746 [Nematocida sp. AWRm77]|nr:hypothetical protein NECID01_0746 [Nematocida sp. AWRm77]